ncbi:MAG: DegT/DnrJ/EryC1/StrS family aminotransferase [Patescibacteria group bacterium]
MIFNSLGSNFSFASAFRHLVRRGEQTSRSDLVQYLESRYNGTASLFYRGRGALARAIEMTGASHVGINAYTCYAVPQAVMAAGASPVYLDVAKDSHNYDLKVLSRSYKKQPKMSAVIAQNTFGISIDIEPIEKFCRDKGITLIEDLAHSVGMRYKDGREAGTVGDLVMLSFGRDKHIDAVSGGALIVRTDRLNDDLPAPHLDPELTKRLRDRIYPLLTWKVRKSYKYTVGRVLLRASLAIGLISRSAGGQVDRMTRMSAQVAAEVLLGFKNLDADISRRQKLLADVDYPPGSNMLRLPMKVSDRKLFLSSAKQNSYSLIDTWYDSPVYPSRYLEKSGYTASSCPNAETLSATLVNIPLHINIDTEQVSKLIEMASST